MRPERGGKWLRWTREWLRWLSLGAVCLTVVALLVWLFKPTIVDVSVVGMSWERAVRIDRLSPVVHEGWSYPSGASDVRDLGERVHHHENVFSHYENENYTETVVCGRTCREVRPPCKTTKGTCKSNKNGFATCTDDVTTCPPPKESCVKKMCEEKRVRKRAVTKSEPRYRTWYRYTVNEWVVNRTEKASGTDAAPRWPEVLVGENERTIKFESFTTTLKELHGNKTWQYRPDTEAEFQSRPVGSRHRIEVSLASIRFLNALDSAN
jgi:hypothetical protein